MVRPQFMGDYNPKVQLQNRSKHALKAAHHIYHNLIMMGVIGSTSYNPQVFIRILKIALLEPGTGRLEPEIARTLMKQELHLCHEDGSLTRLTQDVIESAFTLKSTEPLQVTLESFDQIYFILSDE